MGVTVGEADVGDMAAVAIIFVAWCLEKTKNYYNYCHKKKSFQQEKDPVGKKFAGTIKYKKKKKLYYFS